MIAAYFLNYVDVNTEELVDIAESYGIIFLGKTISAPEPKRHVIDVPLSDGEVDITSQYGRVKYNNREIVMRFEVKGTMKEQYSTYSSVLRLSSSYKRVVFSDDPEFYWRGLCAVSALENHGSTSGFTIRINAFPYKARITQAMYVFNSNETKTQSVSISTGIGWIEGITPGMSCELTIGGYTYLVNDINKHEVAEMYESNFSFKVANKLTTKCCFRLCKGAL